MSSAPRAPRGSGPPETGPPVGRDTPAVVARVADLVRQAGQRAMASVVVAVDGPSGSGKTVLAERLAARLGATAVHMDDIYPGWDGLADAVPLAVEQVLRPVSEGRAAAYRRWDWVSSTWAATVSVPPTDVLILEGVGSSVGPAGVLADVRVWVEADRETRFQRGIERDGEAYRPYWERWARQEEALFSADLTRWRADVVLDTSPGA